MAHRIGVLVGEYIPSNGFGAWAKDWSNALTMAIEEAHAAGMLHEPIEIVAREVEGLPTGSQFNVTQAWRELAEDEGRQAPRFAVGRGLADQRRRTAFAKRNHRPLPAQVVGREVLRADATRGRPDSRAARAKPGEAIAGHARGAELGVGSQHSCAGRGAAGVGAASRLQVVEAQLGADAIEEQGSGIEAGQPLDRALELACFRVRFARGLQPGAQLLASNRVLAARGDGALAVGRDREASVADRDSTSAAAPG